MSVHREVDDIEQRLIHHVHDHAPVHDVNQVHDQRRGRWDRLAEESLRIVSSWPFLTLQVLVVILWVVLNSGLLPRGWDPSPHSLLLLCLVVELIVVVALGVAGINRVLQRNRLEANQAFQSEARSEEEMKAVMRHLEAQDELVMQILHRLDRNDDQLRKIARRVGVVDDR